MPGRKADAGRGARCRIELDPQAASPPETVKKFLVRRWFLIALAAVLATGLLFAEPLRHLTAWSVLRQALVAAVLLVMALPIRAGAMWGALRRPWAPLLAVGVNLGLAPLLAWGASSVLSAESATGLLAAAATPCTLASAAVWTRRAGGNDSVSIFVTLLTNASCFVVTPLWLLALTGQSAQIPVGAMIGKLAVIVVLPMMLAQLLRPIAGVGGWATEHKTPLGVAAQCGVLVMVFWGAIQTGLRLRSAEAQMDWLDAAMMAAAVLGVHLSALWAGYGLSRILGIRREDSIAVAFAGSQKTLMVGLQVCLELQITILPMVAYHASQLLVDTVIADRFRGGPSGRSGAAAAEGGAAAGLVSGRPD